MLARPNEASFVPNVSRALLFAAGFVLWTSFALPPWQGGVALRESWDSATYWSLGVPLMSLVQVGLAAVSRDSLMHQPLRVIAGHSAAMLLLHPAGRDLGLLPLSIIFIGPSGVRDTVVGGPCWAGIRATARLKRNLNLQLAFRKLTSRQDEENHPWPRRFRDRERRQGG